MAKNRLDFQANLSRHSHNLSAGYTATLAPGMIIPQWFDVANPGDTYYLQPSMFCRLQDVVTAFLGEIDVHIDTFFVPLQMMYLPFGQIFAQTDDFISSKFNFSSSFQSTDKFPLLKLDFNQYQGNILDGHSECVGKETMRLYDALNVNPLEVVRHKYDELDDETDRPQNSVNQDLCLNPSVAPWLFCAYQAIYQKYYRNDELERLSINSFNFDDKFGYTQFGNVLCTRLRYVQRPSDYFTNIRVSPIASAVNKLGLNTDGVFPENGGSLSDSLLKVNSFLNSYPSTKGFQLQDGDGGESSTKSFDSVSTFIGSDDNVFNDTLVASNIRSLFAIDKFARIWGRADKTYDDQILAHFGIKIPHDVKHDLTHLKSYHFVIQSDPVYGTANNYRGEQDEVPVSTIGQVGGQAQSSFVAKKAEKFTAPVHGVVMCVAYVVTKPRYFGTFSKLHMLTERLSFPIPEFDKLGAQPIYGEEFHPAYGFNYIAGWQNRYNQFKQKYNRVSLVFNPDSYSPSDLSFNVYSPWVLSRTPFYKLGYLDDWSNIGDSKFVDASYFFESASALDSVMAVSFDPNFSDAYFQKPHLTFQSDPIISEFYMNAKKVSWMSETGEPDL